MIQFKNPDTGYRLIEILLELERKAPDHFAFSVEKIQSEFEEINAKVGNTTVMGNKDSAVHADCEKMVDLHDFIYRRFQNLEIGRQLIITLMEIEARDEDMLYGILGGIESVSDDFFSKQVPKEHGESSKILPFQR